MKNDAETSPSNVVSVERLKKKVAEDDFIVDYHYGDSVSNDDEVARINAKLAEKQRRKLSVGDGTSQVTISSSTSDSSYYPSTNSEFSTPGKTLFSKRSLFVCLLILAQHGSHEYKNNAWTYIKEYYQPNKRMSVNDLHALEKEGEDITS